MEVRRDRYLNNLIDRMHNGMIKVITSDGAAKHICCSNSSATTSGTS